jgi:hypothetical protein
MMMSLAFILVTTLLKTDFTGEARLNSGELFYREQHQELYKGENLTKAQTIYFDESGNKIAELSSDYSGVRGLPQYRYQDLRSGYEDGVEVRADKVIVFRKPSGSKPREEIEISISPQLVSGQGFNHLVRNSLQELISAGPLHVKLILPSRLDYFQFRARLREANDQVVKVRFEIDNWILRLFASHLDLVYERKTKRLIQYEGISNIEDSSGKHPFVKITYQYPDKK